MSFIRKIERNRLKNFRKKYKKTMKKWKKSVRCSVCGREPFENEKIDNWTLSKADEKISLVCTDCEPQTEEESD